MICGQKKGGVRVRAQACGEKITQMFMIIIIVMAVIWVIGVGCAFAEALGAFHSPRKEGDAYFYPE
jgi:hypothetical protein